MSFSTLVKGELCRQEYLKTCCIAAELAAVFVLNSEDFIVQKGMLKIDTENAGFARSIFSSFKNLFGTSPHISIRKSRRLKKHVVYIVNLHITEEIAHALNEAILKVYEEETIVQYMDVENELEEDLQNCCKKAFLRGLFLAGGSMSDPEKTYHLEITTHSINSAHRISEIINSYELHSRVSSRKGYYIVYLKEGENIVDFLNIIGAHTSLLELENVRIVKEMRNSVNRIVNCETANLDKTISAAVKQVDNIRLLDREIGIEKLPKALKEIARYRLEFPDMNLKELGEQMSPPLGKSGVNHRLKKIEELAEKYRK